MAAARHTKQLDLSGGGITGRNQGKVGLKNTHNRLRCFMGRRIWTEDSQRSGRRERLWKLSFSGSEGESDEV